MRDIMLKQQFTTATAVAVLSALIAGCGGGDEPRPHGDVVIQPRQQAAPEVSEPAEEPAGDAVAATPAETPAQPAAADEPEMAEQQSAQSNEVAAAPAGGETPAEAPAAAAAEKGTTFKGRIVVTGDVPTISPITPSGTDAYCIDLGKIPNDEVIVGENKGLADVFVWVRKAPSGVEVPAPPEEAAVLDQRNCRFVPPALVVQVGQRLLVKNDDATLHNTRMSGLTISFNQTVGPNNREGVPVDINRPEIVPVPVKCDIHSWMSARLLATDNPWHAVTDTEGNFEINNLPAGVELDFRLQHGKAGYVERSLKLTLKEGEVKEQTFEVDASKLGG
jgi:hypothetical protein